MLDSQYDAVFPNIGGTKFTGYYKQGINMKLSDGTTVVTIWKPGRCPYNYQNQVYKDAMIEFSGNATNRFTYLDMQKINQVIELSIDYLNKEDENLIDRSKVATYEHISLAQPEKKKTSAIKYDDLEIGGVYLDEKKKKWIFLGQGTLLCDGSQRNRSNDGIHYFTYMYMEYPDKGFDEIHGNEINLSYGPHPDTYASKKRFFEKCEQLPVDKSAPIVFNYLFETYKACHGVKPKSSYDQFSPSSGRTL